MVNYCRTQVTTAPLSGDFGRDWATKLFGADVLAQVPTYQRGPKKGLPKGYVGWEKCTVGGWDRRAGGAVMPGLVRAWLSPSGYEADVYRLEMAGRVDAMSLDRHYLFPEGRERLVAERAAAAQFAADQRAAVLEETRQQQDVQIEVAQQCDKHIEEGIDVNGALAALAKSARDRAARLAETIAAMEAQDTGGKSP